MEVINTDTRSNVSSPVSGAEPANSFCNATFVDVDLENCYYFQDDETFQQEAAVKAISHLFRHSDVPKEVDVRKPSPYGAEFMSKEIFKAFTGDEDRRDWRLRIAAGLDRDFTNPFEQLPKAVLRFRHGEEWVTQWDHIRNRPRKDKEYFKDGIEEFDMCVEVHKRQNDWLYH
jgi:hypothetical protein